MENNPVPQRVDAPWQTVTIKTLAAVLGLAERSVRSYERQGKIPSMKYNGRRLIPFEYVEAYMVYNAKTVADFEAVNAEIAAAKAKSGASK